MVHSPGASPKTAVDHSALQYLRVPHGRHGDLEPHQDCLIGLPREQAGHSSGRALFASGTGIFVKPVIELNLPRLQLASTLSSSPPQPPTPAHSVRVAVLW